jgi:predicted nucleic acid-binding protein
MRGVLVDSSVILDLFLADPAWADWSERTLSDLNRTHDLFINAIIYTEVSIGFKRIEELEEAVAECRLKMIPIPREALFLAGKAFHRYRGRKGKKVSPLPDFFVGAHAAVEGFHLVTRDIKRIRTYFPTVRILSPYQ